MEENYIVLDFSCSRELCDILIAELGISEFDSFVENDHGFECSVSEHHFNEIPVLSLLDKYNLVESISYSKKILPNKDWNKEWEKNFPPIFVENSVLIRAPFHSFNGDIPIEIIIQPKMSFGTGHHETTYMMLQAMLKLDFKNKIILDAGCGTGILSIMAEKKGADRVYGIDIDDWAVLNSNENIILNRCANITIAKTTLADFNFPGKFEIILANINRNVLLNEIQQYSEYLPDHGILLLSGYYVHDCLMIENKAREYKLMKVNQYARNQWSTIVFEKKTDYFS